jgi:hypothetical protein
MAMISWQGLMGSGTDLVWLGIKLSGNGMIWYGPSIAFSMIDDGYETHGIHSFAIHFLIMRDCVFQYLFPLSYTRFTRKDNLLNRKV